MGKRHNNGFLKKTIKHNSQANTFAGKEMVKVGWNAHCIQEAPPIENTSKNEKKTSKRPSIHPIKYI